MSKPKRTRTPPASKEPTDKPVAAPAAAAQAIPPKADMTAADVPFEQMPPEHRLAWIISAASLLPGVYQAAVAWRGRAREDVERVRAEFRRDEAAKDAPDPEGVVRARMWKTPEWEAAAQAERDAQRYRILNRDLVSAVASCLPETYKALRIVREPETPTDWPAAKNEWHAIYADAKAADAKAANAWAGMSPTDGTFRQWAGGASRATLAIAFTDIVSSAALGMKLGDRPMDALREVHFQHTASLVKRHNGYVIKTIGDSVMAAFHAAAEAMTFAMAVYADPGDGRIQVRVGIHVGPVTVDDRDAHGSAVNYAARVVGTPKGAEIWISNEAKGHVDMEGVPQFANLPWQKHSGLKLRGFPGKHILWSFATR